MRCSLGPRSAGRSRAARGPRSAARAGSAAARARARACASRGRSGLALSWSATPCASRRGLLRLRRSPALLARCFDDLNEDVLERQAFFVRVDHPDSVDLKSISRLPRAAFHVVVGDHMESWPEKGDTPPLALRLESVGSGLGPIDHEFDHVPLLLTPGCARGSFR